MFKKCSLVPHVMLGSEGQVVDFSLDPINSPPIAHTRYFDSLTVFNMFFGYIGSGNRVYFYGQSYNTSTGANNVMVSNGFGRAAYLAQFSAVKHFFAEYAWIGSRVWVVGGVYGWLKFNLDF